MSFFMKVGCFKPQLKDAVVIEGCLVVAGWDMRVFSEGWVL